jgi:GH25 family lysozyme M1 (1,4-beta-N-acetylmuramidase)
MLVVDFVSGRWSMTIDPLFVDVYQGDGTKDWSAFVAAGPPWHGVIFKATQGLYYRPPWFAEQRKLFLAAAGARHGVDLFDGAYHYLDLSQDGAAQADYFMRAVTLAGGELAGTLWGMVDVERGGQRITNPTRAQVEDCTRKFAERYHAITGRLPTLYGGELLRAVGVTDRLGCGLSAIALYGRTLPQTIVKQSGTDLDHLMLWQYAGTDPQNPASSLAGYPLSAPGCGRVDISAMVLPGGLAAIKAKLSASAPAATAAAAVATTAATPAATTAAPPTATA